MEAGNGGGKGDAALAWALTPVDSNAERSMYDATLGRFLSRDPMASLDPANLYAYVHDRPTGALDPLGLYNNWTCCSNVQQYWQINGYTSADNCVDRLLVLPALGLIPGAGSAYANSNRTALNLICRGWFCIGGYAPTIVAQKGRCWTSLWICKETQYRCNGNDRLYAGTEYGVHRPDGHTTPTGWLCE